MSDGTENEFEDQHFVKRLSDTVTHQGWSSKRLVD